MKSKLFIYGLAAVGLYFFVPQVRDFVDKQMKWGKYKIPKIKTFESVQSSGSATYNGPIQAGEAQTTVDLNA